jgi:hypothetical protein
MTTMPAAGLSAAHAPLPGLRTPATRLLNVVRLYAANPYTVLILPFFILIGILLVNIAIWVLITIAAGPAAMPQAQNGLQYSGAAFYPFVYFLVVAVQAINITFSIALGYGTTRRNFYLGTVITFVLLAASFAIVMAALGLIEQLSGGWWLGGHMFTAIYFGENWWIRLLVFFFGLLFALFTGSGFAAVWVRWKTTGLVIAFAVLALLVLGSVFLLTLTGTWNLVGAVFGGGPLAFTAWLLIPAGLSAIAGYFILRRATPRS